MCVGWRAQTPVKDRGGVVLEVCPALPYPRWRGGWRARAHTPQPPPSIMSGYYVSGHSNTYHIRPSCGMMKAGTELSPQAFDALLRDAFTKACLRCTVPETVTFFTQLESGPTELDFVFYKAMRFHKDAVRSSLSRLGVPVVPKK